MRRWPTLFCWQPLQLHHLHLRLRLTLSIHHIAKRPPQAGCSSGSIQMPGSLNCFIGPTQEPSWIQQHIFSFRPTMCLSSTKASIFSCPGSNKCIILRQVWSALKERPAALPSSFLRESNECVDKQKCLLGLPLYCSQWHRSYASCKRMSRTLLTAWGYTESLSIFAFEWLGAGL